MAVVTPTLPEIFEEAYERAGLVFRGGYELRSIRRSLNLLLLEWQNRGLNLFTVQEGTQALTEGTGAYVLPAGTFDLIEHQIRTGTGTSQIDTTLNRISVSSWAQLGSKNMTGKPHQLWLNRGATSVTANLWPVPDSDDYTLYYVRLAGIDGLASGIGTSAAIPPRFVPALVSGLAFLTAMKNPQTQAIAAALKADYEDAYRMAAEEDTDASAWFVAPWNGGA